jgi:hypothetical protein
MSATSFDIPRASPPMNDGFALGQSDGLDVHAPEGAEALSCDSLSRIRA